MCYSRAEQVTSSNILNFCGTVTVHSLVCHPLSEWYWLSLDDLLEWGEGKEKNPAS